MDNNVRDAARRLIAPVQVLRQRAHVLEAASDGQLQAMSATYGMSAHNMLHFLAVHRSDTGPLKRELAAIGMNPFSSMEMATMATLNALLVALYSLAGDELPDEVPSSPQADVQTGQEVLAGRTRHLLGGPTLGRNTHLMVTAPPEAATEPVLCRDLLSTGMSIVRVDCSQDGTPAWQAMIRNCRQVEQETGKPCKILLDLAGSRPRTGSIESAGRVAKFQPKRDLRGRVVHPAQLGFVPAGQNGSSAIPGGIPLPKAFWEQIRLKDEVKFKDARGRNRTLTYTEQQGEMWLAEADDTCYLETGTVVRLARRGQRIARGEVGRLPEVVLPLTLQDGDILKLVHASKLGRSARFDLEGNVVEPARIPCSQEYVLKTLRPGERVWFDDGRIGAVVMGSEADGVLLVVTHAPAAGARLRAGKVIYLPDSAIHAPAFTAQDIGVLRSLGRQVDMVTLSCMRTAEDVAQLQRELRKLQAEGVGLVIKVDTRQGFENLPRLLLAALLHHPVGVLLARGDLAVELGIERLAEVQEEVAALCAAAHVPLIWEALLNDGSAKNGQAGRAESLDLLLAHTAECVLIGPVSNPWATVKRLDELLMQAATTASNRQGSLQLLPPLPVAVGD